MRVMMGGHPIPPAVIARRYLRSLHNFRSMYLPIADTWNVYDNSEAGNVRLVARRTRNGAIAVYEETSWKIIQSI